MLANIDKYLARHACDEARGIASWAARVASSYRHACVIPAFDESVELIEGLAGALGPDHPPVLFVVVVNATDAADPEIHARNAGLCDALCARARHVEVISDRPPIRRLSGVTCQGVAAGDAPATTLDVLLVDRTTPGHRLPPGHGVGLARRIGCDIALALRRAGTITGRWIHTTDADVTLPADYFAATASAPAASVALTYPFWHLAEQHPSLALYEISLRYYVLGLRWAGSPYAHHTIGSTLAVDAGAYAACRGVPRRLAGEDFYLLNKLAKLGPLHAIFQPRVEAIRIRARESRRVPFGTGPATRRIAETLASNRPFRLYNPRSFAALARWLEVIERYSQSPAQEPRALLASGRAGALQPGEVEILDSCLEAMGAFAAVLDARGRTRGTVALKKRLWDWFDGFRTLKLIHRLRDAGHEDVPWASALDRAPFVSGMAPGAGRDLAPGGGAQPGPELGHDLEAIRRTLVALEERVARPGRQPSSPGA